MSLVKNINEHQIRVIGPVPYPPVSTADLARVEVRLGFSIPLVLQECYLTIGNGGFGPGYGVIGLANGHACDFGNLVETYNQLKSDYEKEGKEWVTNTLPFCAWGCNVFSCVACAECERIYTYEDGSLWPQSYSLAKFFELWLSGIDIRSHDVVYETTKSTIINPFTGMPQIMQTKKRKM